MVANSHVFISYARLDGSVNAARLDMALPHRGFKTWRDQRGIDPTQDFTAEIERAIENASYVVTCITSDVRRDDSFVRREIQYAQVMKKPIVVARFDDVAPPISVVSHTWIDFFKEGWDAAFDRLCQMLHQTPGHYVAPQPATVDPFKPYLNALYQQVVRYLDKTVFSSLPGQDNVSLIPLRSEEAANAVHVSLEQAAQTLTMAFFDMAGVNHDMPTLFEGFDALFEQYDGRVLVMGNPGSGKTTALMAFARDRIARRLEDPSQPLPIVAPIILWNPDKRLTILEWLGEIAAPLAGMLGELFNRGELLLLLDGLDELGSSRERQKENGDKEIYDPRRLFTHYLPVNNRIILTCRTSDFEAIGEKIPLNGAVKLRPLDDSQIQHYLRAVPGLWQILQTDDELLKLGRTPLLLSLFAFAFAGLDKQAEALYDLSGNDLREKIFATYIERRYGHERRKPHAALDFSLDDLYHILHQVVINDLEQQEERRLTLSDFTAVLTDEARASAFITLISALNIVIVEAGQEIVFVHGHMRDHFALYPLRQSVPTGDGWAKLGRVQRLLQQSEDSLVTLTKAVQQLPDAAALWYEQGLTLITLQRYAEAAEALRQSTELHSTEISYWIAYGETLLLIEQPKEALAALNRAVELKPDSAEAWRKRAQVLRVMGRNADALDDYDRALRLDADDAWTWNGRGLALRRLNRLQEAISSYEQATRLDPTSGWYVINLAQLLLGRHEYLAALNYLEQAVHTAPNNPMVWAQHGRLLRRLRRFVDALPSYERALMLAPEYGWAWYGCGLCLSALQRHDAALDAYEKAVSLEQQNVAYLRRYSQTLYRVGQIEKAKAAFRQMTLYAPNHPYAVHHLRNLEAGLRYSQISHELDSRFRSSEGGMDVRSIIHSGVFVGSPQSASMIYELEHGLVNESTNLTADSISLSNSEDNIASVEIDENGPETAQYRRTEEGEFVVGDVIAGRYEVADLRRGGMGIIYLCYDRQAREPVAIKTFQARFLDNERVKARFSQEAFTWIQLERHPNIVQCRLIQQIFGRPHLVLEFVSGPEAYGSDLGGWIAHNGLDLKQSLEFGLQIARAMEYATQKIPGLVHRDLKPGNILITHDGIAKVSDFGLVRAMDFTDVSLAGLEENVDESQVTRLTRLGAIVGTAPYMSPEQAQSRDVDMRSDIYAFGSLLYEMLTGRHVFQVRRFNEWLKAHIEMHPSFQPADEAGVPAGVRELVLRCLNKRPEDRPASWAIVTEELAQLYQDITDSQFAEINISDLEARALMDKGYSLTELRRPEEALDAYNKALELKPDYAWAWAHKGRTLRLLNRYDEALACYDRALEIQPRYAFAWTGKGLVLERMGNLEQALACHETAAQINPLDVWHWCNQADVLQAMNRHREAIPLLEKALQIDPKHPNSWAKLGQVYRLLHEYPAALKAYERAIELDPEYAWAHNGYGLTLQATGRIEDALASFKRASKYQPDEVWHWYNVTESLVNLQQYQEALYPAEQAVRTDPNHAFSWAKLGQVYRYVKRYEDGLNAYNKSIELQPDYGWAINGKGIVLERMGRYEEALACYEEATKYDKGDVWHSRYNQANVLVLLKRYKEALPLLEHATRVNPNHSRSWARLGNVLRNQQRYEEALQAYRQATQLEPNYAWAWNEQGLTLETMGLREEALKAYRNASLAEPSDAFYLYQQADLLVYMEQYQQALDLLDQALKLDDSTARVWAKQGQVLRRLKLSEQALASYTHAVELDDTYAWAWNGRGLVLSELGRHEEALMSFQRAVETDPDDVWYWYNRGNELVLLNRFDEAVTVFDDALKRNAQHAESWGKRGQALRQLDKLPEALASYDQAINLKPNYDWAWNGRGLILQALNRLEEALASFQRASALDSASILYYTNQAEVLLDMQRKDEALALIDQALQLEPENALLWARRGQILRRLHQHEAAVESYQKAVTIDPTYAWAWNGLGLALTRLGRHLEAQIAHERAVQHDPGDPLFLSNLGDSRASTGDSNRTTEQVYQAASEIDPTLKKPELMADEADQTIQTERTETQAIDDTTGELDE